MSDFNNYFFNPDGDFSDLSDDERESIKRQSMLNTYRLIVNNYDFEIFPDSVFWLLTDYDELTVFDILIKYFSDLDREEYEKCARLRDIKKELMKNKKKCMAKKGKFTYNIKPNEKENLK
jgi:hypothetical protein